MSRSVLLLLLKLLVSGGLLFWVLGSIDGEALFAALGALDPHYLMAAFLVLVLQYPLGALRWLEFLRLMAVKLPLQEVLRAHFVGIFLNQMLPSALGGDAFRVWSVGRSGNGWSNAVCSVLLDRVAALMVLILLLAAMLPHLTSVLPEGGPVSESLALLVGLGVAAILVGLVLAEPIARLLEKTPRLRRLAPIARHAELLWRRGASSLRITVFGLMTQLSTVSCVYFIAAAAGLEVSFWSLLGLVLPVLLTLALPISIAGWGVREGAMVFALGFVGVAPETGLVISLVWGALALFGGALCGVAFLLRAPERQRLAIYAAEVGAVGTDEAQDQ